MAEIARNCQLNQSKCNQTQIQRVVFAPRPRHCNKTKWWQFGSQSAFYNCGVLAVAVAFAFAFATKSVLLQCKPVPNQSTVTVHSHLCVPFFTFFLSFCFSFFCFDFTLCVGFSLCVDFVDKLCTHRICPFACALAEGNQSDSPYCSVLHN